MINEFRRARRRKAADTILVTDAMTERVVGHIGNLSESGLLLIASETLVDDALYQLQFALPDGKGGQPATVEVGAHLLWMDRASAPGQAWIGFRFIAVAPAHRMRLQKWIEAPGGHYE
ncbi:PilZ domain-containing protein [Luteimonas sp. 22616]|uniref:PilZ domain-containing protein n=1 Tax=Luteimonas sp. 22616 TaxID=3453951 RepID=UPI003F834339